MDINYEYKRYRKTPKVISFANYKGGVAKTTTTALMSVALAKLGYKVLDIDLDPQATLTTIMARTGDKVDKDGVFRVDKTLMQMIENHEPFSDGVINVVERSRANLSDPTKSFYGYVDLIPSTVDFSNYDYYIFSHKFDMEERFKFLKDKIDKVKDKYDFVFLDVSPALDNVNWAAYYACDYLVIPMKTDEFTYNGTNVFVDAIDNTLVHNGSERINSNVDILGVIPTVYDKRSDLDVRALELAKLRYEDGVFHNYIPKMKRIRRYGVTGITDDDKDPWDKKVHEQLRLTALELIDRLRKDEQ